jgi:hypothetical protein
MDGWNGEVTEAMKDLCMKGGECESKASERGSLCLCGNPRCQEGQEVYN